MYLYLLGSVFLGWSLGSNDAANVFGTAVASGMVRWRTAVVLIAIFVILGAALQGGPGIERVGKLTDNTSEALGSAFLACVIAGATVTLMTMLKLPVSTTQSLAGAVIGVGLFVNPDAVNWNSLIKMAACWVGTPTGAALVAVVLYPLLGRALAAMRLGIVGRSIVLKASLVVAGTYGAYALGANSVGNVTGVFYGTKMFVGDSEVRILALIGGVSIAIGVLTYSRNVMYTVGSKLVTLDAFSALVAVLAEAVTVHAYAMMHVPVSTSQAMVGGVLGIGIYKGIKTIRYRTLAGIALGWVLTPLISGVASYVVAWAVLTRS